MGLYFHCHADYKALLKRLLIECGMEIGKFTDDTSHFYNFSHVIFEVNTPNIFQVIEQLSAHLNHFISLLMPAVQTYSQNNPSFGIVSLT
jgi:selenocysteine lyase/cysteine desulfurase